MIIQPGIRRFNNKSSVSRYWATVPFWAPLKSSLTLARGIGSPTYTRATSATCYGYQETDVVGASQSLLTIPAGYPRFSGARWVASTNSWSEVLHDGTPIPDSQLLGYLAEGAATNYFLNSGAPATQTISLGIGTYTTWLTGTGSITTSAGTATATGYGVATAGTPNTITVTVAGTVVFTVAGTVTIAQVENTAFPTSYIATTGTAVTRNEDVLSYPSSGNLATLLDYSTYCEFKLSGILSSANQVAIGADLLFRPFIDVGSAATTAIGFFSDTNGVALATTLIPSATKLTQINKVATRKDATNHIIAGNGAIGTQTAIGTQGAEISLIYIGSASAAVPLYGNIRNVRIWQTQLPNAILQAITT